MEVSKKHLDLLSKLKFKGSCDSASFLSSSLSLDKEF